MFLTLLTILAAVNAAIVQAIKTGLNADGVKYSSNAIAGITAVAVGVAGFLIWMVLNDTRIEPKSISFMIMMVVAVWMSSMLGFDKVKQLIQQIGDTNA